MLRPQSGSEHELADPLTSLCCLAPVLRCRHVLCGDQTRPFSRCAGPAQRDGFVFSRLCREFLQVAASAGRLFVFSSHPLCSHSRWSIESFESCDSNVCQQCCLILGRAQRARFVGQRIGPSAPRLLRHPFKICRITTSRRKAHRV